MKHTNEELVRVIQSGQREYIPQLWEQVSDFIRYMADRHLNGYPDHYKQLREDMINQAYFGFLKAVEQYQPRKGKFTTYLNFHMKNSFNEVLCNRTVKEKNEPLNAAVSIDIPVDGTEELTLGEMLIDTTSEAYYRRLEDDSFWKSVNQMLVKAIDTLEGEMQELFSMMLEYGTGFSETLRLMGIDDREQYKNLYQRGLKMLRRQVNIQLLKGKKKDITLEECIYYYSGFGAWVHNGYTSAVERAVIKRNNAEFTARSIEEVMRKSG